MSDAPESYPYDLAKRLERAVMEDRKRECLYGVAGPCSHPNCLEDAYQKRLQEWKAAQKEDIAT